MSNNNLYNVSATRLPDGKETDGNKYPTQLEMIYKLSFQTKIR